MHFSKNRFSLYPAFLLISCIILLLLEGPRLTGATVTIVLRQSAILGLLSTGLGLVVLTGEIDLSVGAMLALGSVISSFSLIYFPHNLLLSLLLPVFVCSFLGFLNGLLVAQFHFPAAVVTLAQALVFCGFGSFFDPRTSTMTSSPAFYRILNGEVLGIPIVTLVWVVLLSIVSLCLHYTYWGQYIYVIGSNEQALLLIGINTTKYKLLTFSTCGFFAGLAGVFMLARTSTVSNSINPSLLLESMGAIAISGIGFSRSSGKLPMLLIGTFSLAVCKMCMTSYAVSSSLQSMVIGLLLLISLFIGRKKT